MIDAITKAAKDGSVRVRAGSDAAYQPNWAARASTRSDCKNLPAARPKIAPQGQMGI
jgi:hypothetical protein